MQIGFADNLVVVVSPFDLIQQSNEGNEIMLKIEWPIDGGAGGCVHMQRISF